MNIPNIKYVNKTKSILSVVLFAVIFGGLLALASVYDLEISKILTQNSLKPGEYIASNGFALFFEAIGAGMVYIMLSLAGVIAFWYGFRSANKLVKIIYCLLGLAVAVVPMFLFFKDILGYLGEYIGARLTMPNAVDILIDNASELATSIYAQAICLVLALGYNFMLFALWKRVSPEKNAQLVKFSYIVVCTFACYLIIEFIKSPWGRARYRTMNYLGNFDLYTPWYTVNGKRKLFDLVGTSAENTRFNFVGDACKSFPSGHTFSAGVVYSLLALPYLTKSFSKKYSRALLWAACIAYTGVVALSRIVAGAHFFSDVLMGGTIAFLGAMLFREIFACKGAHVKALFGCAKLAQAQVPAEEQTQVQNEAKAETEEKTPKDNAEEPLDSAKACESADTEQREDGE